MPTRPTVTATNQPNPQPKIKRLGSSHQSAQETYRRRTNHCAIPQPCHGVGYEIAPGPEHGASLRIYVVDPDHRSGQQEAQDPTSTKANGANQHPPPPKTPSSWCAFNCHKNLLVTPWFMPLRFCPTAGWDRNAARAVLGFGGSSTRFSGGPQSDSHHSRFRKDPISSRTVGFPESAQSP